MVVQEQQQQSEIHHNNISTPSSPYFIINYEREYEETSISMGELQMINETNEMQGMINSGKGENMKILAVSSRCNRLLLCRDNNNSYINDNDAGISNKYDAGISNKENVRIEQGQILNVYYKENNSISGGNYNSSTNDTKNTKNKPQEELSITTIKQSILVLGCDEDRVDIERNLRSIDRSMFLYQEEKQNNHIKDDNDIKNGDNDQEKLSSLNLSMMKGSTMMKGSIIDEFGLEYEKNYEEEEIKEEKREEEEEMTINYNQEKEQQIKVQELPKIKKLITHLLTEQERSSESEQKQPEEETLINYQNRDHFYYQQELRRREEANHVHNELLKMNVITN